MASVKTPLYAVVLDVSNVRPITPALFRASKACALIAKATEGSSYQDATLAEHRRIARQAGVPFGSYVFLHPRSPGDEAALYLHYARPLAGDIQPIIDAEALDGGSVKQMAARVDSCALELEAHGYRPILYASASFWQSLYAARPALKRLRVWEAQYPGRFSRWLPRLAALRIRLGHGATVVLWQWTDRYDVGGHGFDASRLFVPIESLLIPAGR